jgi:hypothetical protein
MNFLERFFVRIGDVALVRGSINFSNFLTNVTKLGLSDNVDIYPQSWGIAAPGLRTHVSFSHPGRVNEPAKPVHR